MALKAKSDEKDESSEDEDAKLKSFINRQFKKFIKNATVKGNDKDCEKSAFCNLKSQDKTKRDAKDGSQTIMFLLGLNAIDVNGMDT